MQSDAEQTPVVDLNDPDTNPFLDGGAGIASVAAPLRDRAAPLWSKTRSRRTPAPRNFVLTLAGSAVIHEREKTVHCPVIDLGDKKVFLLSGFVVAEAAHTPLAVTAREKLEKAAERHRDAVAFGYVSGKWVPAA